MSDILELIVKHKIHIVWEEDSMGEGPQVYCEGASSWKDCLEPEDLYEAIQLCIKQKMEAEEIK